MISQIQKLWLQTIKINTNWKNKNKYLLSFEFKTKQINVNYFLFKKTDISQLSLLNSAFDTISYSYLYFLFFNTNNENNSTSQETIKASSFETGLL